MVFLRVGLFILTTYWAHVHLVRDGAPVFEAERKSTPQNFRFLSRCATLGYFELGADRAWIQFINYFGDKRQHRKHYPDLFSFLERAQILDPFFLQVYQRIGLLSSLTENQSDRVLELLAEGEARQPRDWLIPFLRASLLMQQQNQLKEAARVMKIAAERPGAPDYLGLLSVRLATAGGDLDAALAVVAQLETQATDETSREILAERRRQIHYEEHLRAFSEASRLLRQKTKGATVTLEALYKSDATLPKKDPWGAAYVLGVGGEVISANAEKRLKVVSV